MVESQGRVHSSLLVARPASTAATADNAVKPRPASTPPAPPPGVPRPRRSRRRSGPNGAPRPTCPRPASQVWRGCGRRAGSVSRPTQDTSAALAGAYPFLAEGGLGSDGVFVGQDLYSGGSFVYDPWVLYQRGINVVLAGIVGAGKSSLAKSALHAVDPVRVAGGTCPATPKANTPESPKRSAARRSCSATASPTASTRSMRVTRPSGVSDVEWGDAGRRPPP